MEEYNTTLKSFKFKSNDASDRPQPLPLNMKVRKLCGKACSIWVHIKCFPLIIRNYVKEDNTIFHLGLMLHELVERLTASEFYEYEIETLEELIIKYLDERKEVFSEFPNLLGSAKPKTHFLTHYPQAVRSSPGPLDCYLQVRT